MPILNFLNLITVLWLHKTMSLFLKLHVLILGIKGIMLETCFQVIQKKAILIYIYKEEDWKGNCVKNTKDGWNLWAMLAIFL